MSKVEQTKTIKDFHRRLLEECENIIEMERSNLEITHVNISVECKDHTQKNKEPIVINLEYGTPTVD